MCDYIGYKVSISTKSSGSIIGTVARVEKNKVQLEDVRLVDAGTSCSTFSINAAEIADLRVLAIESKSPSPPTDHSFSSSIDDGRLVAGSSSTQQPSSRDHRRERLRNMPNARNAYTCPESPPLILNRPQPKPTSTTVDCHSSPKLQSPNNNRTKKSRSTSISNNRHIIPVAYNSSDASGPEESGGDSINRRHKQRNRLASGSRNPRRLADWDHVHVEDFIDHDFDFEHNLALFDKAAFYSEVDSRRRDDAQPATNAEPVPAACTPTAGIDTAIIATEEHILESPKYSTFIPSDGTRMLRDYYTVFTNTATQSLGQCGNKNSPNDQPAPAISSSSPPSCMKCSTTTASISLLRSPAPKSNGGKQYQWGVSTSSPGTHRVPLLRPRDRLKMLNCLALGAGDSSIGNGLTWDRLIEASARSLTDRILTTLRSHSASTPKARSSASSSNPQQQHRHLPPRILILPSEARPSSWICIALARLLANRGACVALCASNDPIYANELALARNWAPKPFQSNDDDNSAGSSSGCDSESESSDLADVDSSSLARMWLSRLPGLKTFKRPNSINQLPNNVRTDMVIIGHSDVNPVALPNQVVDWLANHSSLSHLMHLTPEPDFFSANSMTWPQAASNWIVELGLPCSTPAPSDSDHHLILVDVGLTRQMVRRFTTDLQLLPSRRLFDLDSIVELTAIAVDSPVVAVPHK